MIVHVSQTGVSSGLVSRLPAASVLATAGSSSSTSTISSSSSTVIRVPAASVSSGSAGAAVHQQRVFDGNASTTILLNGSGSGQYNTWQVQHPSVMNSSTNNNTSSGSSSIIMSQAFEAAPQQLYYPSSHEIFATTAPAEDGGQSVVEATGVATSSGALHPLTLVLDSPSAQQIHHLPGTIIKTAANPNVSLLQQQSQIHQQPQLQVATNAQQRHQQQVNQMSNQHQLLQSQHNQNNTATTIIGGHHQVDSASNATTAAGLGASGSIVLRPTTFVLATPSATLDTMQTLTGQASNISIVNDGIVHQTEVTVPSHQLHHQHQVLQQQQQQQHVTHIQQQQHQYAVQQQQQVLHVTTTPAGVVASTSSSKKTKTSKVKRKRQREEDISDSLDQSVYPDDFVYIRGDPSTHSGSRHIVNICSVAEQHDMKALRLLCPRMQEVSSKQTLLHDEDDDDEQHNLTGVWEYGKVWNHHLTIRFLEQLSTNKKRMFSRDARKVLYLELAKLFQDEGHKEITTEELEKKWCSLLSSYKRNSNRLNNGEEVSWGYYKIMDDIMTEGRQIRKMNREKPKRGKQRRVSDDEAELRYTKAACRKKMKKLKRELLDKLEVLKQQRIQSMADSELVWQSVRDTVEDVTANIGLLNSSISMLAGTLNTFLNCVDKLDRTNKPPPSQLITENTTAMMTSLQSGSL